MEIAGFTIAQLSAPSVLRPITGRGRTTRVVYGPRARSHTPLRNARLFRFEKYVRVILQHGMLNHFLRDPRDLSASEQPYTRGRLGGDRVHYIRMECRDVINRIAPRRWWYARIDRRLQCVRIRFLLRGYLHVVYVQPCAQ